MGGGEGELKVFLIPFSKNPFFSKFSETNDSKVGGGEMLIFPLIDKCLGEGSA